MPQGRVAALTNQSRRTASVNAGPVERFAQPFSLLDDFLSPPEGIHR